VSTFLEVLTEVRGHALHAAEFRDNRVAREELTKLAAKGKKAVGLAQRLKAKLTGLFAPDPMVVAERNLMQTVRQRQLTSLSALTSRVPTGRQSAPRFVQSRSGQDILRQMGNLKKDLEMKPALTMKKLLGIGGIAGASLGADALYEQWRYSKNLSEIEKDPMIPQGMRGRAKEIFKVLRRYAPSIAKDPTVSKDFSRNLVRHQAIDHAVVKDLIRSEKEYRDTKGKTSILMQGLPTAVNILTGIGG
jgi:hypothetical protein